MGCEITPARGFEANGLILVLAVLLLARLKPQDGRCCLSPRWRAVSRRGEVWQFIAIIGIWASRR